MLARQLIEAGRTPPDEELMAGAAAIKAWMNRDTGDVAEGQRLGGAVA